MPPFCMSSTLPIDEKLPVITTRLTVGAWRDTDRRISSVPCSIGPRDLENSVGAKGAAVWTTASRGWHSCMHLSKQPSTVMSGTIEKSNLVFSNAEKSLRSLAAFSGPRTIACTNAPFFRRTSRTWAPINPFAPVSSTRGQFMLLEIDL